MLCAISGVVSASINLEEKSAVVRGKNLDIEALVEAVEDVGFDCEEFSQMFASSNHAHRQI